MAAVVVEGARDIGLFAAGDGTVMGANDVAVIATAGLESTGTWGRGINAQHGASMMLTHLLVDDARDVGVASIEASVEATGLVVRGVREEACGVGACAGAAAGHGVGVYGGALRVERFGVERTAICGIHVASVDVSFSEGSVTRSAIGACVQDPMFDVARIMDGVRYQDNETNLQSTELPLPEAGAALPPR